MADRTPLDGTAAALALLGGTFTLAAPGPTTVVGATTVGIAGLYGAARAGRWLLAVRRIHALAVNHGLFDTRRARKAKADVPNLRIMQAHRGRILASGWRDALPTRVRIYARVGLQGVDLDSFTSEVNHYTREVYQAARVPGTRRVDLTLAPPLPERAAWPDLDPADEPWQVPLGVGRVERVGWDVAALPHLLVGAGTGWGKSTLVGNVLGYVTSSGRWQVYGLDPDGELDAWAGTSGIRRIASDPEQVTPTLELVAAEMDARSQAYAAGQGWEEIIAGRGRILVVLDEEAAIWRDADQATRDILVAILQRGRKRGVHVLAATQQPNARVLPTELRDQFAGRLAGRLGPQGWDMVLAERPPHRQPARPGLGWWRQPDGDLVEVQAYSRAQPAPPRDPIRVEDRQSRAAAPPDGAPSPSADRPPGDTRLDAASSRPGPAVREITHRGQSDHQQRLEGGGNAHSTPVHNGSVRAPDWRADPAEDERPQGLRPDLDGMAAGERLGAPRLSHRRSVQGPRRPFHRRNRLMGIGASIVLGLFGRLARTRLFWWAFGATGLLLSCWIWLRDHTRLDHPGWSLALVALLFGGLMAGGRIARSNITTERVEQAKDHGAQRAGQMAQDTILYNQAGRHAAPPERLWGGGTTGD
jgi:hypothetical protein